MALTKERLEKVSAYAKCRASGGNVLHFLSKDAEIVDQNGVKYTGTKEITDYYNQWRPTSSPSFGSPTLKDDGTVTVDFSVSIVLFLSRSYTATFQFLPESSTISRITIIQKQ